MSYITSSQCWPNAQNYKARIRVILRRCFSRTASTCPEDRTRHVGLHARRHTRRHFYETTGSQRTTIKLFCLVAFERSLSSSLSSDPMLRVIKRDDPSVFSGDETLKSRSHYQYVRLLVVNVYLTRVYTQARYAQSERAPICRLPKTKITDVPEAPRKPSASAPQNRTQAVAAGECRQCIIHKRAGRCSLTFRRLK